MPLLRVLVDETQVAAVSTDGLDVLAADLGGTKIEEDFSSLGLHGSVYPSEGESTHLIWINALPVRPGQRVRVEVEASGATSHVGKTIDELFPEEAGEKEQDDDLSSREDVFESLALRAQLRTGYRFAVQSSAGTGCVAETSAEEHGFSFGFLWNTHRPDRVSASLHTYSLEQVRLRGEFTYHWRAQLRAGDWAEVTVEA